MPTSHWQARCDKSRGVFSDLAPTHNHLKMAHQPEVISQIKFWNGLYEISMVKKDGVIIERQGKNNVLLTEFDYIKLGNYVEYNPEELKLVNKGFTAPVQIMPPRSCFP